MKLHGRWLADRWWKAWSTRLLAVAMLLAELAPYLPDIHEALPANWYVWAFRVILVARIVKQTDRSTANDAQ